MAHHLRSLLVIVIVLASVLTAPPQPAAAFDSYATYNGGSFTRIPDGQPIMTMQETCVYCVASGTQAWIDYTRLVNGQNTRPSQTYLWGVMNIANGSWGAPYDTSSITRCSGTLSYTRRGGNVSTDDGVDPYGTAWQMYLQTPAAYYYHINVYSNGSIHTGFDYAAHGIAYTLAEFSEPVGMIIDNGGHFVLVTFVTSDVSPLSSFWTNITLMKYRDPFISPGASPYWGNRIQKTYAEWRETFTEYGWTGHSYHTAPNCGSNGLNCRDETRKGPYANNLWWGRWVTVERDNTAQNADLVWQLND